METRRLQPRPRGVGLGYETQQLYMGDRAPASAPTDARVLRTAGMTSDQ
jgi:hypothetical protein